MIGKSGEKKKRIKENEKIKTKEGQGKESEKGNQGKRKNGEGERKSTLDIALFFTCILLH